MKAAFIGRMLEILSLLYRHKAIKGYKFNARHDQICIPIFTYLYLHDVMYAIFSWMR